MHRKLNIIRGLLWTDEHWTYYANHVKPFSSAYKTPRPFPSCPFSSPLHLWLQLSKNASSPGIPFCQQNSKGITSGRIQISDTGTFVPSLPFLHVLPESTLWVRLEYFQLWHLKTWKNLTLCSVFNSERWKRFVQQHFVVSIFILHLDIIIFMGRIYMVHMLSASF